MPVDSPGTLRPVLYRWFNSYLGLFSTGGNAFLYWKVFCFVLLLTVPAMAVVNYYRIVRTPATVFWITYGCCLFVCRYPILLLNELNPDEGQFLTAARKLFSDANFFRSVDCGTSGPGNIYPLMLPAVFGITPDFASARVIGLIAIFLSVYVLYRAFALLLSEDLARIAILPVAGIYCVLRGGEFLHYSSEHIPVLLVSVALFLSVRIITQSGKLRLDTFLLGLTTGAALLTKMQSLPIVGAAAAVSLFFIWVNREWPEKWESLLLAGAGVLLPPIVNGVTVLEAGVWTEFWERYVVANIGYVATSAGLTESLQGFIRYAFQPAATRGFGLSVLAIFLVFLAQRWFEKSRRIPKVIAFVLVASGIALIRPDKRMLLYALLALLSLIAALVYFLVLWRKGALGSDPVRWFGLLGLVCAEAALYSVYKPHRGFDHYLLFLFVPFCVPVGWILARSTRQSIWLPGIVVILTAGCDTLLWSRQDIGIFHVPDTVRAPEGYLIRTVTQPEDRLFVWGWTVQPYLSSGRVPAARDMNVRNHFRGFNLLTSPPRFDGNPSAERVNRYHRERLLQDLRARPPALFIDAIGPASMFLTSPDYFGFGQVAGLAEFVDSHYVLLTDLYNERFYLRKDLAARREAAFSKTMPPLECVARSLRCLDMPLTVPGKLPPIQTPQRVSIRVQFMPVGTEVGPATVFNTEVHWRSFKGLRLRRSEADRYALLIGLGDRWVLSKEFACPEGEVAYLQIDVNGTDLKIRHNGISVDDMKLAQPVVHEEGPITLGSWIDGIDPFAGKIQFFEMTRAN